MNYLKKSFKSAPPSNEYRENFDRIFRGKGAKSCRLHEDCDAADARAKRLGHQPDHHCEAGCACGKNDP